MAATGVNPREPVPLEDARGLRPAIEPVLLPALFDSQSAALVSVDRAGTITALAPSAEAMLGYAEEELVGSPLHATIHAQRRDGSPLPEPECPIASALAEARPAEGGPEVLTRKDGTLVEVSWAVAPIVLSGWRTGGVIAFFDRQQTPGSATRELGHLSAVHSANARLSLLADATHVLLSTPDLRSGLARLARLLVPTMADWVVIDLIDPNSGRLERAALAHRHPDLEQIGLSMLGILPAPGPLSTTPLSRVLRGGPTEHISSFAPVDEARDELGRARLELFHALGSTDAITAPLRTRRRTIGAFTLVRSNPRRAYRSEDLALATELAGRVGLAVENSWLLEREQRRAEEMQLALLPSLPDHIGEVALTGVYRPADDLSKVGGDWYDAFRLSDGNTALVIGDVAGHDLHTATRMGAVRHKLRAIAGDRVAPPSEILERLDTIVRNFSPEDMVTLIYGRLVREEDGTWTFEWSSAGHPPPVLLRPDRPPQLLNVTPDPPIGVLRAPRHDHRIHLGPSSELLFYTDGLIERSAETCREASTACSGRWGPREPEDSAPAARRSWTAWKSRAATTWRSSAWPSRRPTRGCPAATPGAGTEPAPEQSGAGAADAPPAERLVGFAVRPGEGPAAVTAPADLGPHR